MPICRCRPMYSRWFFWPGRSRRPPRPPKATPTSSSSCTLNRKQNSTTNHNARLFVTMVTVSTTSGNFERRRRGHYADRAARRSSIVDCLTSERTPLDGRVSGSRRDAMISDQSRSVDAKSAGSNGSRIPILLLEWNI